MAGVSTGIAAHLNWPVTLVRVGFVALASMQLIGVFVYGLLWMLMPPATPAVEAPGLESAKRRRCVARADNSRAARGPRRSSSWWSAVPRRWRTCGPDRRPRARFWPMLLAAVGLAIDLASGRRAAHRTGRGAPWTPGASTSGVRVGHRPARGRWGWPGPGVSVTMVALSQIGVARLPLMLGLAALMVLGVGIAAAPWLRACAAPAGRP